MNPRPLAGLRGLRGLGDAATPFSGCVQAYDSQSNPVSCSDPSAAVWIDAQGNAVPAGTASTPVTSPGAGGAPSGSLLLYQGQWQVTPTLNVSTIISRVSQALRTYGLQVINSQTDGGAFTLTSFNVTFTLQVTGSGFAQPSDAGSIVDHALYTVTGHMPVFSSTVLQAGPGASIPILVTPSTPAGSSAPGSSPAGGSTLLWFEQNAMSIGLLIAAMVVLPPLIRKL